jgi:hypothetical protein
MHTKTTVTRFSLQETSSGFRDFSVRVGTNYTVIHIPLNEDAAKSMSWSRTVDVVKKAGQLGNLPYCNRTPRVIETTRKSSKAWADHYEEAIR